MARRKTQSRRGTAKEPKSELDERFLAALGDAAEADDTASAPPEVQERQTFGNTPAAWMMVELSPDGQQALLNRFTFGGDTTLSDGDIVKALREQYRITNGIDDLLVKKLTVRALNSPKSVVNGSFPVARGTPPVPGEDGRLEYAFSAGLDQAPDYSGLARAFAQGELDAVLADAPLSLLVQSGQELAHRTPATQGESGWDIYGNESFQPGADPPLEAGPNVRQDGARYIAAVYGYACLLNDQLSVLPPLWISPDRMEAYFIRFPLAAKTPRAKPEWILDGLMARDVKFGIDQEGVEKLCRNPPNRTATKAVLVAQGTPPVPGVDTKVNYTFDPEKRAGKILPDGSIDLRERNAVIGVEADQHLGTVVPATVGQPGTNLHGEQIETTDGREIPFKVGENVRAEDGPASFFAAIDGNIHLGETLHVKPVFVVNGDVDYGIGNIDSPMDVQIKGTVRGGFTIKAGGSITVDGTVEAGATLSAHGDIAVCKGILGERTEVSAPSVISLGQVETKFIQNASVLAKGDIAVGSYIFNSSVRAGGDITVHTGGGKRSGSIVGGETFASRRISCRLVGSPSTTGTTVGISGDPTVQARLAKLNETIAFCESNTLRVLRTIGLQTVEAERIKALLYRTPKAKKKSLLGIVKKLYELMVTRDQSIAEREGLENQIEAAFDQALIEIEGTLFSGSDIVLGKSSLVAKDDMKNVLFFKAPNGIGAKPRG